MYVSRMINYSVLYQTYPRLSFQVLFKVLTNGYFKGYNLKPIE